MKSISVDNDVIKKVVAGLQKAPLFESISSSELAKIVSNSTLFQGKEDDVFIEEGVVPKGFYILVKGTAKVIKKSANDLVVEELSGGDCIGGECLVSIPSETTVVLSDKSLLLEIATGKIKPLMKGSADFGIIVSSCLANRTSNAQKMVSSVSGGGFSAPASPSNKGVEKLVAPATPPAHFDMGDDHSIPTEKYSEIPGAFMRLLRDMAEKGVSDLHLSSGHAPRWRIDGAMQEIRGTEVLDEEEVYHWLAPTMEHKWKLEFFRVKDLDYAFAVPGVARFRVNVFYNRFGISSVLRQIAAKILTYDVLGLPPIIRSIANTSKGMILVTGPTGSGKSTTLAAIIDDINKTRHEHILTFEDPIEFTHTSMKCLVNQREIGTHTNSFKRAVKSALREDPDIILMGEMRDQETVHIGLETANTGHLVFGTLHTSTAISTIDRIIDLFPPEQKGQILSGLAESIRGIIAQTLCKKKGGGRVAALEILVGGSAAANIIREGKTNMLINVMQTGRAKGNQLLNDELSRLVREELIDTNEAMSKSLDKPGLAKTLDIEYNPA